MDKLAAYEMLLENHPLWEKTAFSASKLLPAGTALGGSVLGGVGGAMSTKDPAERKKRALMGAAVGGLTGGLGGEVLRRGNLLGQAADTAKSLRNRADELGEQVGSLESRNSALDADLSRMTAQHKSSLEDLRQAQDDIDRYSNSYTRLEQEADDALAQVKRLNNELSIRDSVIDAFKTNQKAKERQIEDALARATYNRRLGQAISGLDRDAYRARREEILSGMPDELQDAEALHMNPEVLSYLRQYGR